MKEIPLTQGRVAIIDDEDADLAEKKWYAHRDGRTFYAVRTVRYNGKQTLERMHRMILARKLRRRLLPGEETDHINSDGLDNVRANLRVVTHAENARNRIANRNIVSGYKGVTWNEECGKWRVQIMANKHLEHLGFFDSPCLAAVAYNIAALMYHGEFAKLNEV